MNTNTLTLNFHGTDLFIIDQDGQPFTPMKTIVEGMGLGWQAQYDKLTANAERWGIRKILIPTIGSMQEAICLPLRKLSGWLATIHPNKVKTELRDTIIQYQDECDDVLWEYWTSKHQPQYGLKQLPPSPYISEPEAAQFMKSIQAHCKSNGGKYSALYKKVYDYYGITSYKHIPAGKLEEAARLCGMKLLKLVKSKIPDEIPLLTFTQDELDTLIAERIKVIEGELLPKETEPAEPGEKHFLIKIKGDQQTIEPVDINCYYMTEERFICHLKNSGRVVFDKTGASARQIVMHHIPPQFLPDMIEEAWAMLRRIEAEKVKA